jgi:hypothetical protein
MELLVDVAVPAVLGAIDVGRPVAVVLEVPHERELVLRQSSRTADTLSARAIVLGGIADLLPEHIAEELLEEGVQERDDPRARGDARSLGILPFPSDSA